MADFTALNAAVTKLQGDVTTLLASAPADVQPQIDAATAAVTAIDDTVFAAIPVPPTGGTPAPATSAPVEN